MIRDLIFFLAPGFGLLLIAVCLFSTAFNPLQRKQGDRHR
jgi:hypothetical protein